MKSNTITINLNYNENELQLDMEDLINSIKFVLNNKYKENNIAYEVIDTSITTINVPFPQYPVNPSPFRYEKTGDTPSWWNNTPQCTITPNCPPYTTPITMNVNNNNKKGTK